MRRQLTAYLSEEEFHRLRDEADEVVCAAAPRDFQAVSLWYDEFSQTTDQEVRSLLEAAAAHDAPAR